MSGIEVVLIGLGVIVLLSFAAMLTIALVLRSLYRRYRRNRVASGASLRTRARVSRGPQRTVLALRVRLDESLRSGRAAVELAAGDDRLREIPRLFSRVAEQGAALDLQLRLMESETDAAALAAELTAARARVEQVEHLVRRVRGAVASGFSDTSDDALGALDREVDHEVAALRAGVEQLRAFNRRDGLDPAPSQPEAAPTRPASPTPLRQQPPRT
ncbi:hypothetical protein [Agromyces sp. LHK192]|uniref:hypothetical protein n=1 Tax=Agromyces sp. LHK192 TaxID=2498704 RepID=UPI000FD75782|nr:hypothetical protein [Agromyces sp. LHK192]